MTTYYVSPSGSDSNSGQIGAPFATPQKAVDQIPPFNSTDDTTIILKDGVYTNIYNLDSILKMNYKNQNDTSHWITIKAENRFGAVFDDGGSGVTASPFGIEMSSCQNIIIQNIEIRNTSIGGIESYDCNHIHINNNKIHDNGQYTLTCDQTSIILGKNKQSHGGVEYGRALLGGSGCSDIWMNGNILYNNGRLPGGCPPHYDYDLDHHVYNSSNNLYLINNIIYQEGLGQRFIITGNWGQNHYFIANNTFYCNATPAPDSNLISYVQVWGRDYTIANNIFYIPSEQRQSDGAVCMYDWNAYNNPDGAQSIKIYNNLIYGNGTTSPVWYWNSDVNGHDFDARNNIYLKDPKFIFFDKGLLKNQNFHLQSTSPCIGAGTQLPEVTYDFDGNPRTGRNDIGAFQYINTSTCPDLANKLTIIKL